MKSEPRVFPTRLQLCYIAVLFSCFTVYGSLVPLDFRYLPFAEALQRFRNIPYLSLGIGSRADWVSNMLLFIPVGYFWMAAILDKRSSVIRVCVFGLIIVLILFVFSVGIEFIQIWFPPRTVSLNDIAAETIGAVVGSLLWTIMGRRLKEWLRSFELKKTSQGKLAWILQAYCIGFLFYSFLPFDLTISVAEVWHKVKQGKVILIPFSNFEISPMTFYGYFRDFIAAVPLGIFFSTWRSGKSSRTITLTLIYGGLFISGVEIGQLFIYSRSSDMTDIILSLGGIWVGRQMVGIFREDSVNQLKFKSEKGKTSYLWLVAMIYAGFLVMVFCYPFEISTNTAIVRERYLHFFRTPFTALYYGSEFNAVSEMLKKGLFFSPLGIISGLLYIKTTVLNRLRLAFRVVLLIGCLVLAAAIEVSQIFMPAKIADFTDILLCTCGAWAGFFLITRLKKNENKPFSA